METAPQETQAELTRRRAAGRVALQAEIDRYGTKITDTQLYQALKFEFPSMPVDLVRDVDRPRVSIIEARYTDLDWEAEGLTYHLTNVFEIDRDKPRGAQS